MQSNIYPSSPTYSNMDFPYEFTKQGQQERKEKLTRGEFLYPNQEQLVEINSTQPPKVEYPVHTEGQNKGNMLSSLMPLLTTMSNPNANMNDMLKLVAPYVNSNGLPVTDLIKLMSQMSQNQSQKKDGAFAPVSSTTCNIDKYSRVQ